PAHTHRLVRSFHIAQPWLRRASLRADATPSHAPPSTKEVFEGNNELEQRRRRRGRPIRARPKCPPALPATSRRSATTRGHDLAASVSDETTAIRWLCGGWLP
ncbi:unnamed protein product, partial [Ectocarpus sp. 8 AP-2014]